MKRILLCALLLIITAELKAESLQVNDTDIYVVSSFENRDFFTVYSHSGEILWEAPFNAQILSWKTQEDRLLVFVKARNSLAYFLICLKAADGTLLWEKAIFSPGAPSS